MLLPIIISFLSVKGGTNTFYLVTSNNSYRQNIPWVQDPDQNTCKWVWAIDLNSHVSFISQYKIITLPQPRKWEAESAVKFGKNILKKSHNEDLYFALLVYWNTPQEGYDYSPAERLMSWKRQDIIPTATSPLVPKLACSRVVQENIAEKRNRSKV